MFLICSHWARLRRFSSKQIRVSRTGQCVKSRKQFDRCHTEAMCDTWASDHDIRPTLSTKITTEYPRSFIRYNRSTDLPFDCSINPYRACEHGCVWRYARPSHAFLGILAELDFETRLIVRKRVVALLGRELCHSKYDVQMIALMTNNDPYQPVEKYEITWNCLK